MGIVEFLYALSNRPTLPKVFDLFSGQYQLIRANVPVNQWLGVKKTRNQ